jgi:3-hydroxyisobutyrate dehydrogenase
MSTIVGVVGLGPLGRAIGERLRESGLRVLGYDDDVQAAATSGLRTVGSAERLVQECEIELVSCDGDRAVEAVERLLALGGTAQPTLIVLAGVLEPSRVRQLVAAAITKSVELVDAPIEGGESAILASQAVVLASGTRSAVDRCAPVFQAFGRSVYVGEAGVGQVARTVNDVLHWSNVVAVTDAFALAQACGADAAGVREAVLAGSGASRALETWGSAWSDPEADLAGVASLAQNGGINMPFLQNLPSLAEGLDISRLNSLFNLGIADLSQPEHEAHSADAEELPIEARTPPSDDDSLDADAFLEQEATAMEEEPTPEGETNPLS